MSLKKILAKLDFRPDKKEMDRLSARAKEVVGVLKEELKRNNVKAEVFLGGSMAKGTLMMDDSYDVDIFVRFEDADTNISEELYETLSGIVEKLGLNMTKQHGSRDYFRLTKEKGLVFEIIPVAKIKKPANAKNVTDLSYFHVNYVKKKIKNTKLAKEITLAKKFCKAQKVYGAESYIQGFSGYALECLIIHYKSFEKMINGLLNVEKQLVIDPEKHYKNKSNIAVEVNESRLKSPVVLIDPTWKERNVLAALSRETFDKFRDSAARLINNPSEKFFEVRGIDKEAFVSLANKQKSEFIEIKLETEMQDGDIAGTKLKKFANMLMREISVYFNIQKEEFEYGGEKEGMLYLVLKSKCTIEKTGPRADLKEHAARFREKNKEVYEREGILYAKVKVSFSARDFIKEYRLHNKEKLAQMSIVDLKL